MEADGITEIQHPIFNAVQQKLSAARRNRPGNNPAGWIRLFRRAVSGFQKTHVLLFSRFMDRRIQLQEGVIRFIPDFPFRPAAEMGNNARNIVLPVADLFGRVSSVAKPVVLRLL